MTDHMVNPVRKEKGPEIQRDLALLIQILRKLEHGKAATEGSRISSITEVSNRFIELAGYKPCKCSSCFNLASASRTQAALLEKHLHDIITVHAHSPNTVYNAVWQLLGSHLYTFKKKNPPRHNDTHPQ